MTTPLSRREALTVLAAGLSATPALSAEEAAAAPAAFTVVVMDPLAAPLSCPCVKGYAQRDYAQLGKALEAKLGRAVAVCHSESLTNALAKKTGGRADLLVGKDSVVRAEAAANQLTATRLAALTGKDGKTTQTGLVVVASSDPALTVSDLKDYRVIFGPAEAAEKHGAALALFRDLNVPTPKSPETCVACTDGATKVIDAAKKGEKVATVISSYAQPLLEGCGTIKKGDLRVVGETDPVPFVAAFVTAAVSPGEREVVAALLLGLGKNADLCKALETKAGFVAAEAEPKKK